ncbi:MAG: hypothetical protein QXY49_00615 [Thermofilaceae archaeon]
MLSTLKSRLALVQELRKRGFYVRWHAYEFLLGYNGRLIGTLLLEPSKGKANLFLIEYSGVVIQLVKEAVEVAGGMVKLEVFTLKS